MYILIVEDDPVQSDFIEHAIKEEKEFFDLQIKRISRESEFRNNFGEIADYKPEVIIMDIMMRWADPAPDMQTPPKEIRDQGFYRAGIRCIQMLSDDERTRDIPIIIYSILDKEDLEEEMKNFLQARYLSKDFDARKIINMIKLMKVRRRR